MIPNNSTFQQDEKTNDEDIIKNKQSLDISKVKINKTKRYFK